VDGIGAQLMRKCVGRIDSSALLLAYDIGHGSVHAIVAAPESPSAPAPDSSACPHPPALVAARRSIRGRVLPSSRSRDSARKGLATHPSPDRSVLVRQRILGAPASVGHERGSEPPAACGNPPRKVTGARVLGQRIWKVLGQRVVGSCAVPPNRRIQLTRRSARLGGRHWRAADAHTR